MDPITNEPDDEGEDQMHQESPQDSPNLTVPKKGNSLPKTQDALEKLGAGKCYGDNS
jgi:hypothetical protein